MESARKSIPESASRGLKVYFQDEGRFGRMSDPVSCWAPSGIRPKLPLQRVREYTYAYSAICPADGDVFSLLLPYSDTGIMQVFIDEFVKYLDGQPALLIMDQAPWHKSGSLRTHDTMMIAFQPPYSPELNPVEHFWEHLREKHMSNRYWENMDDMENELCRALRKATEDRETIKKLSLFDWMVYV